MLAFSAPGSSLGKLSIATPKSTTFLSVLEPITNGEPADTAIVTGPSGTGKTCISNSSRNDFREEVLDVEAIYVNCWRNYTRFRTLYQILDDLGATIDIHRQSTPHDELVDRLQQHDGPRTVVILDEVDQLEDPSVIYDLHSLPQFALICIANKEEELFSRVDDRLVSRLRSSEHVRMDKYHDEQLYDILSARTKWGSTRTSSPMTSSTESPTPPPATPASQSASSERPPARLVVRTTSASPTIFFWTPPRMPGAQIKQKSLDSLTPHQRVVYDIVREHGPIGPSEIHERYSEDVDDPRTKRTIRTYLLEDGAVQPPRGGRDESGTESTRSSIRQRRRRCSDRDAVSYQELNSPSPDCSWSNGSMTGDRRCRDC